MHYFPLFSATFILECKSPFGAGGNSFINSFINDLCWLDEVTLLIIQYVGRQVLKAIIDTQTKTCSISVIDSGYEARRSSCSPNSGMTYVTDDTHGSVWIYNRAGYGTQWYPPSMRFKPITVAVNKERIVLGGYKSPLFVYNKNREFLYEASVAGNPYNLWFTYISDDGLLISGTGSDGHKLIVYNLNDESLLTLGGYGTYAGNFNKSADVCIAWNGILVSDFYNQRISVFSLEGRFLHQLQVVGRNIGTTETVAVSPSYGLLAVSTASWPHDSFRIYSLRP